MKLIQTRSRLAICVLALLAALPATAAKRRSVSKPTVGPAVVLTVRGTVLDSASNLPVAFVNVTVGDRAGVTSREGNFEISNVTVFGGSATVTASRSGYNSATQTVNGAGTHTLTFRLQGRPTVNIRKIDGTNLAVDDDSVKFGYVVLFGGYVASTEENFCMADGAKTIVALSTIKRILGPATPTQNPCCPTPTQKIRLELRNGTNSDANFEDSCHGYTVDILARNHTTGDTVFVPFSEVAELVFP